MKRVQSDRLILVAEPSLRSRKVINSGYRRLIGFYCSLTFANLFYLHILFYYTWDFTTLTFIITQSRKT